MRSAARTIETHVCGSAMAHHNTQCTYFNMFIKRYFRATYSGLYHLTKKKETSMSKHKRSEANASILSPRCHTGGAVLNLGKRPATLIRVRPHVVPSVPATRGMLSDDGARPGAVGFAVRSAREIQCVRRSEQRPSRYSPRRSVPAPSSSSSRVSESPWLSCISRPQSAVEQTSHRRDKRGRFGISSSTRAWTWDERSCSGCFALRRRAAQACSVRRASSGGIQAGLTPSAPPRTWRYSTAQPER